MSGKRGRFAKVSIRIGLGQLLWKITYNFSGLTGVGFIDVKYR